MGNSNTSEPAPLSDEEKEACLNLNCSLTGIVEYIRINKPKNIVLMVGAGISVSAGIPDFRSPGSGLYNNLQKYNLPDPQIMFSIDYFKENPAPFFDLAKALFPTNFVPTPFHFFIKLLQNKGILRRCYTQNIDTLERQAGVHPDLLVEAHGSFGNAHCMKCGTAYSQDYFKTQIFAENRVPGCACADKDCLGYVKPDIVFFGTSILFA